jgi:hypothetical protein
LIVFRSFTSSHVQIHTEPLELHTFLNSLQNYNRIRFSAYRTGMKLFAVQKRLCLDLVEISELANEFNSLPAGKFLFSAMICIRLQPLLKFHGNHYSRFCDVFMKPLMLLIHEAFRMFR